MGFVCENLGKANCQKGTLRRTEKNNGCLQSGHLFCLPK